MGAMEVLYCGDGNIRDGVLVSVLSLLANQGEALKVTVATARVEVPADSARGLPGRRFEPVDARFVEGLDALLRRERPGSGARLVDATAAFAAGPPTANMRTRFTPLCMLRLYADLFEGLEGLGRVLYLDYDVVCKGDVSALYGQDMGGAEVGGVLDRYGKWLFHSRPQLWDYLNSGVLLMDMARMRETGLLSRCRELCRDKRMFMPDQSAINKLAQGKFLFPRRFNEQLGLRPDTALQHFSTRFSPTGMVNVKPWQVERVHKELGLHAYDDVLARYQELRPRLISETEG